MGGWGDAPHERTGDAAATAGGGLVHGRDERAEERTMFVGKVQAARLLGEPSVDPKYALRCRGGKGGFPEMTKLI